MNKTPRIWTSIFACLAVSAIISACIASDSSSDATDTLRPDLASQTPVHQTIEKVKSPTPTKLPTGTAPQSRNPTQQAERTHTPTTPPTNCLQEGGRKEERSIRSDWLPLPMEYLVYLPPCYDDLLQKSFPVLYMIHGQNYDHTQWENLGITEIADQMIASEEIPPLIIVMPRDRNWAQPTEDNFGKVLVEELIPTIDRNYRTIPERSQRAIGGLSRGAGWAVHLGLSQWQLFGAFGAHSLPVFWTDTRYIREWLDSIPDESRPRIFLDIGDRDRPQILASAIWFEELLTELGISHEWYLFPGYHEEAYWQAHLPDYLRWYTDEWQ